MINISNAFKNELYNGNVSFLGYADITLSDDTVLHLTNENFWNGGVSIEDAVSNDNAFEIGSTIINKCTLTINNIYDDFSDYDFSNAKVIVYIGLELPDGTTEKIRKGTYTVDETQYDGSIISLSCLDNMSKFDKAYTESSLQYPATLNQIVLDACNVCGVSLQTYDFPHDDFLVNERPNDEAVTFREIIGWCAQISCCFCRCDTQGRLELKWYDQEALEDEKTLDGGTFDSDSPYSTGADADGGTFDPWNDGYEFDSGFFDDTQKFHHIYSNYSSSISTDDVVITGVRILEKSSDENSSEITTYQTGTEGYIVSIENNELIKNGAGANVVGWIGEQIIGFRFRKAQVSHTSNPSIEAGDVGFLTDRKQKTYRIIISSTNFATRSSQSTSSSAETPLKNSASRFSESTKNYVDYRKEIQKERTDREEALEELGNRIDESSGLFTTEEIQGDGSTIFYLHNKPQLSESNIVWKMTAEAWGVSTDGGKTYNAGMTVDGDTITRILTATGINADWIKTGAFTIEKDGKIMFKADTATGQVDIVANSFSLKGQSIEEIANQQVNDFVDAVYTPGIANLQAQIDGQIETYYYDYEPTLTNEPASEWTTETERQKHEGDLFYWKSKGYAYRFFKDGNTWKWQMVQDTDITAALEQAAQAQDTADQKRRVFVSTPVPPYDVGDLWTQGSNGDIMRCQTSRQSGAYNSNDWVKASKYTDNTFAQEVQEELQNLQIGGRNLIRNSSFNLSFSDSWNANLASGSYSIVDGYNKQKGIKITRTGYSGTSRVFIQNDVSNIPDFKKGDVYTLSAWVKIDTKFDVDIPIDIFCRSAYGSTSQFDHPDINVKTSEATVGVWKYYKTTYTFTNDVDEYSYFGIAISGNGACTISCIKLEKGNKATDWSPAPEDTETYADNLFSDLQDQLDGKIETWNQTNDPSSNWAMPDFSHEGDLWYNPNTKETKRWNGYDWDKIENKEAEDAAELAQSKAQVFTTTPYPPYYVGDLWITALNKTGVVKTCKTTRTSGSYNASDWVEGLKYTDDSAVDELNEVLNQTEIFNRLTNNGKTQGIYMQNGLIYVNASYIQTGILSVKDTNNNETFYANTETGEVRIKATSFSLTSGKTIGDIAQDAVDNLQIGGRNLLRDTDAPSLKKISGPADRRFSNNMDGVNAIGSYIEVSDSPCSSKYGVQIEIKNANGTDSGRWIVFYDRLTEKSMDITFEVGEEYTLSCYIRSISGNPEHHMGIFGRTTYGGYFPVTTEWKRYSDTFIATESMNTEENARAVFGCNANAVGVIQLTGFKLEKGSKPTEWSPAPEDLEAYTDDKVNSLDTSLNQQDIFNRLTNNGQNQGIYLKNNKIYVNASYIQSGTLRLGGINNQYGVLQIMSSTNTPIGTWDKDGINITNNGTIRNKVNNNEIEIAGGRMDINYSDTDVGFIGSNLFNNEPGLVFDLQDGNFMTWSVKSEESSQFVVKFYYIKNGFNNYQSDSLNVAADMYFWSHNMHMQGNDIQMDGGDISDVNLVNAWVKQGSSFNVPTNTTLNFKSPLNMNSKDIQNANLDNVWVKANAQFVAANNSILDFYTQLNMHGYAINNTSLNDIKLNDISSINGRAPISRQVYLPTLIGSDGTCSSWIVVDIEDGLIVSS